MRPKRGKGWDKHFIPLANPKE
ncbi:uncharacterized protein G2W53_024842 [Senna tora]|uniref:Uncharacterized protein n=1 Tax=Senna tora TaxID=362788 RepID=A0A834TC67_9FABA|nr:uncharacterized protein G2W53_024842 [Senna tora]